MSTMLETQKELAHHLRHTFAGLLDLPLLGAHAPTLPAESPAKTLTDYATRIRHCQDCALHIGRRNLVFGRGHWNTRIAFLGDFPSEADDASGEPFSGDDGALLHKMIVAMKLKPEETYLANVFKCRPPAGQRPERAHLAACEKHLHAQFSQLRAPIVVAMGETAARALSRSEAPLQVIRKQWFDWEGRRVICTHHPRDLLEAPARKKEAWEDLQLAMRALEETR